jgi:hypothetical protein
MHLHEDEVPRSGVIIDVDMEESDGQYSIIRLNADKALSDWGSRGINAARWKMDRVEGSNPWKLFVDFLYNALEDAGYEPRPLTDPGDRYGPLGLSSKARSAAADPAPEVDKGYEDDLVEQEIECNVLGADPREATENLLNILNGAQAPEGMTFKVDDDVGRPTMYASFVSDEPGYQVGEIDLGSFEGPEGVDGPSNVIDTDAMKPEDIRASVRGAYKQWQGGDAAPPPVAEPDADDEEIEDADDLDLEESRRLRADPDVYASALLLSGFTPRAVVKILGTQGLKASMSEEEMAEVRALHSAVISEALACNVAKAHRAIRAGVIARNGMLREDLVERYRRALFTKRFAQGFAEDSARLEPFLTFKEQLEFRLRQLKVSDVPGQALDVQSAQRIVDSLSEDELNTIRSNIEGLMSEGLSKFVKGVGNEMATQWRDVRRSIPSAARAASKGRVGTAALRLVRPASRYLDRLGSGLRDMPHQAAQAWKDAGSLRENAPWEPAPEDDTEIAHGLGVDPHREWLTNPEATPEDERWYLRKGDEYKGAAVVRGGDILRSGGRMMRPLDDADMESLQQTVGGRQPWPHSSESECPACMGQVDPVTKEPCGEDPCDCA